jgi:outer membrane protein assembly factor BamB
MSENIAVTPEYDLIPDAFIELMSDSGKARFGLDETGDLYVEDETGKVRWQANTGSAARSDPGAVCKFQSDGNLVVYDAHNHAVWASGTNGHANALLFVQDDGNVVIYAPFPHPVWATNTNH